MTASHKSTRKLTALLMVAMITLGLTVVASAASTLTMSTSYPGVTAKPGETLSFGLDFYTPSDSGEGVELSIVDIPVDFEASFTGGGSEITQLYIQEGVTSSGATFQVTVPDEVSQGEYDILLQAEGSTGTSQLTLTLTVTEELTGTSALVTEYGQQEGGSGTSFTFSSTIQNNTPTEQNYSLSANAPTGWTVYFTPSSDTSTQVAALTVDKNSSAGLSINVTTPSTVEAGTYEIPISVISATQTLTDTLTVEITGSHDITISTPSGRLSFDATSGKETSVVLQVTNNGNVDLTNVNLTSSIPTDWSITYAQSTIDLLEAGGTVEVTAYVTPSSDALSGDYLVTLSSATSEATDSAEFRVTVQTDMMWGLAGVLVIAVAGGCLYFVFRKYGRR